MHGSQFYEGTCSITLLKLKFMQNIIDMNNAKQKLSEVGITAKNNIFWNLPVSELVTKTLQNKQGVLTSTGALMCNTGEYTGRSPKDKYVVKDAITENTVWWGDVNHPFSPQDFDKLYDKVTNFIGNKEIYVKDVYAGAKTNLSNKSKSHHRNTLAKFVCQQPISKTYCRGIKDFLS